MAPLAGIRVLDLTRLLPGPYATLVLSDLGADVVKVEDPQLGDYLRHLPPLTDGGGGGMFAALNRGKRSLALNLKEPDGPALLRRLAARADVLVEGFRPGVLAKFGCSPTELCEHNPRLVACSISGFGQTGPWRARAGHDIGYLALAGVLARCGTGERPELPGVQLADLFGGAQTAALAIVTALFERERTGRGRALDISMVDGSMGLILPHLGALAAGQPPQKRGEDVLSGAMPCYRVYACKGGGAMAVGALEPKFWAALCDALGKPAWVARQFDNELVTETDALFAGRTRDEWAALLTPGDCCAEPVLEPHELSTHPLHAGRDLWVESGGAKLLRTQPAFGNAAALPNRAAPELGENTAEVLRDWNL